MPLTISRAGYSPGGGRRTVRSATSDDMVITVGQITFDSSYDSGGETLLPSDIGLREILAIFFDGAQSGISGIRCVYDYATQRVKAYGGSAVGEMSREIGNGVDLAWCTVRFIALGRR